MDPTTAIASVNLASKLLPRAIDTVGEIFSSDKSEKKMPESSVSFEKILQAQRVPLDSVVGMTKGDRVGQYLSALPELQSPIYQANWASLGLEIEANGELALIRADGSRQNVPLSPESRAYLREIYKQTRESSPPLVIGAEAPSLEIGAQETTLGSASAARVLMWRAS
jgi:hypothetical protein